MGRMPKAVIFLIMKKRYTKQNNIRTKTKIVKANAIQEREHKKKTTS
jgi:hypothetical protein